MNNNPRIMKTLDNPARFFYWDFDVVMIGFFPFIIGIALGLKTLSLGAIPLCWIYSVFKRKNPSGNLLHAVYWSFPSDSLKTMGVNGKIPPSHKRRYFL